MIRLTRDSDFPQVLHIWQACFGDGEDYVQFFWKHGFPLCRGLLWEEDGQAVSMLFLLPGALAHNDTALPAEYVYAVATLPDYRGRGFAGALTERAASIARFEKKAALCLLPGSESLYAYYAKQGFTRAFARQDFQAGFAPPESPPMDPGFMRNPIIEEVIARKRGATWGALGYFAWGPPLLEYLHREHVNTGGQVYPDGEGIAFLSKDGAVKERFACQPTEEPGGMMLPLLRPYLAWFRPGFHPWQQGMIAGYDAWAQTLAQTKDAVRAADALQTSTGVAVKAVGPRALSTR